MAGQDITAGHHLIRHTITHLVKIRVIALCQNCERFHYIITVPNSGPFAVTEDSFRSVDNIVHVDVNII